MRIACDAYCNICWCLDDLSDDMQRSELKREGYAAAGVGEGVSIRCLCV